MSEARMREIIKDQVTTSMNEFMANMNHGAGGAGAGGAGSGAAGAGGDGAGVDGAGGAGAGGAGAGGAEAGGARADGAGIGGIGPVEAEVTGCTYMTFMKCNPHTFKGTEGAVGEGWEHTIRDYRRTYMVKRERVKEIVVTTDVTTTTAKPKKWLMLEAMPNAVSNDNEAKTAVLCAPTREKRLVSIATKRVDLKKDLPYLEKEVPGRK
ncbi:hypothetical protein Tco_1042121 [Tanacetum coccineum]|uniref:Uncharacterized protein n=1 Tax=Tanacetum coccineum TaxID=301880 RepID=A0ABQ5GIK8_9ASTR